MKITKRYLQQVIKEELEKEMNEGFFGDLGTKVFGSQEKRMFLILRKWFEKNPKLIDWLKQLAKEGRLSEVRNEVFSDKKYERFVPSKQDVGEDARAYVHSYIKSVIETLKDEDAAGVEKKRKAANAEADERYRQDQASRGRIVEPTENPSCYEQALGKTPEQQKETLEDIKRAMGRPGYGVNHSHTSDKIYQDCVEKQTGKGSTGISGRLKPTKPV